MGGRDQAHLGADRLNGWKEIAAFLGRDERTAKRWEVQRGLPIRRPPGETRGGVYASRADLREWLDGLGVDETAEGGGAQPPDADERPLDLSTPTVTGARARRSRRAVIGVALAALAAALSAVVIGFRPALAFFAHPGASPAQGRAAHARATEFYRQGQYLWSRRTPASLQAAADDFTQAIVQDPQYAEAYSGLANCYNLLREFSVMPAAEAFPRARMAAQRAVALNPRLADAHAALGFVAFWWEWDRDKAWREFRRAIALDPGAPTPHHWFATALLATGDYSAALREIEQAQALDPRSSAVLADKGLILVRLGRTHEAEQLWRELATADPALSSPWRYLGGLYLSQGRNREGLEALRRAAEIRTDPAAIAALEADEAALNARGPRAMRAEMLRAEVSAAADPESTPVGLAEAYAAAGDKDGAIRQLQTALAQHDPGLQAINDSPVLRPLRGDPRLRAELERARLILP